MKIKNLTIELMVDDIKKSIKFYGDFLMFIPFVQVPEKNPFFVILKNDSIQIMLYQREQFAHEIPKFKDLRLGGSIVLYLEIENIERSFSKIKDSVKIIQQMHDTDYGTREFSFEDFNGYIWMLSEKL